MIFVNYVFFVLFCRFLDGLAYFWWKLVPFLLEWKTTDYCFIQTNELIWIYKENPVVSN